MKHFSTSFLTGIFILLIPLQTIAQGNDCAQTLGKAQDTYKEGRIYEIKDLLSPCLNNHGFSKTERVEAYRLLTLTYLYFNETKKAEEALTNLLHNDPEYKLRATDPAEFVNLYNSFRTTPVLLIGTKAGVNFSDINVTRNYSLDNSEITRGEYKSRTGFQGSLFFQIPLSLKFFLQTELQLVLRSFSYSDYLFEYARLEFPEKQAHVELPVLLNYKFKSGSWTPYLSLGGSLSYMLSAKAEPIRVDETGGNNQREIKEGEINISEQRKKLNYNLLLGGGLMVKDILGRGYLFLDIRFSYGLNNAVNPEKRYANPDLIYKYLYVDNNFKLSSFHYSIGYTYPIYKPKLKKKKGGVEL